MKKTYIVIAIAFLCTSAKAQEISDALRYSVDNLNGTARYRSMSGAFGALGGDLSSINVNPAGSAVFNNNQLGLTISNYNTKNNSNYFGTQTSDSENSFDLNQAGGVFVFKNKNKLYCRLFPKNSFAKIQFNYGKEILCYDNPYLIFEDERL